MAAPWLDSQSLPCWAVLLRLGALSPPSEAQHDASVFHLLCEYMPEPRVIRLDVVRRGSHHFEHEGPVMRKGNL